MTAVGGKSAPTKPGPIKGNGIGSAISAVKGNGGRKGGKKGGRRYGAMGGYGGVPYRDAASIINGQVRHEVRGMQHQGQQVRDLYGNTVGDLNHIFGETGEFIGNQNQKIKDSYAGQKSAMDQIYSALNGQLNSGATGIQDAALAELQRLGISPGASGDMGSDTGFMQNLVAQQQANSGANMGAAQSNSDAVGALLMGMNSGAQASALGQAANTKNSALKDIMAQIRDVRSGRGDAINELLMQMNDSRFQQWLGLQGLKLDRRSMNMSAASQRAGALQDAAYQSTLAQQLQQQYGGNGKPGNGGHKPKPYIFSNNRDQYNGPLYGGV